MEIFVAVVALAFGIWGLDVVAKYAAHHLAEIIVLVPTALVFTVLALRKILRWLEKKTVRCYQPLQPKTASRKPSPGLPEPFSGSTLSSPDRPFTMPPPGQGCEGPECTEVLPEDPGKRYRTGTVDSVPADGGPVEIGEIHDFCSEECMQRWAAGDVPATPVTQG